MTKTAEAIRLGKALRKARGATKADKAAARIGISASHLYGVENGGHAVSLAVLTRAARVYKTPLAELIGGV